jgi:hypothetical protein
LVRGDFAHSILRDSCELAPTHLRPSGRKPRKQMRRTAPSDRRERALRKVKAAIAARSPLTEESSSVVRPHRLRSPKSLARRRREQLERRKFSRLAHRHLVNDDRKGAAAILWPKRRFLTGSNGSHRPQSRRIDPIGERRILA